MAGPKELRGKQGKVNCKNKKKARNERGNEESVRVSGTTVDPSLVFGLA